MSSTTLRPGLYTFIVLIFFAGSSLFLFPETAPAREYQFRDSENCMLCHRYPTIGEFGDSGELRIFYIYGKGYAASVHGKFNCTACHRGLHVIPHVDAKKVDCSVQCHMHGPDGRESFSHRDVMEKVAASVHGKGTRLDPKPFPGDLPDCTYCHDNRDYYSTGRAIGKSDDQAHPSTLLRNKKDVIRLCASCHENEEKMARHGLESIKTFKDTFHWQALKYGVRNAPDCISCHVPAGYSSHTIRPGTDPLSPVNIKNRVQTCSTGGGQSCHPDATHEFAEGRVHEYGTKAQLLAGKKNNMEGRFRSLLAERAQTDIPEEELFHYRVLEVIGLIYKILIGCTIGFMTVHQVLDYRRTTRKGRTFK